MIAEQSLARINSAERSETPFIQHHVHRRVVSAAARLSKVDHMAVPGERSGG